MPSQTDLWQIVNGLLWLGSGYLGMVAKRSADIRTKREQGMAVENVQSL